MEMNEYVSSRKDGHKKAQYTTNHEEGANREIPASAPLSGKTFKDIAEEYLEKARGTIASTTYDRYLDALERDVYPEYANTPMTEVTEAEVNRFIKVAPELA